MGCRYCPDATTDPHGYCSSCGGSARLPGNTAAEFYPLVLLVDAELNRPDPMVTVARDRMVVKLADGRTARLVYWPGGHGTRGRKAVVELRPGTMLSVPPADVVEVCA